LSNLHDHIQGWKGGVRENKPKKRKQSSESGKTTPKKSRKKNASSSEKDAKNESTGDSAKSPSKPIHDLLKSCDDKSPKTKALPTKNERDAQESNEEDGSKSAETTSATNGSSENDGKDHMDAANVLLGLGGSSGSE
jgi:hypothetical protein